MTMHSFDLKIFHQALDERRRQHGLSWSELAAEVNRPFAGLSSLPINVATMRDLAKKSSVTSAVILQLLRWMDSAPECFLAEGERTPSELERLPQAAPNQILRFDTGALYEALDQQRQQRGMTWKEVAAQLPAFTAGMLSNLRSAPLIGFPRVMALTQWLGLPAASFVRARSR
jgi:hypothetical protein